MRAILGIAEQLYVLSTIHDSATDVKDFWLSIQYTLCYTSKYIFVCTEATFMLRVCLCETTKQYQESVLTLP